MLDADERVRRAGARRDVARTHRPADPQRREHRHRRQRPRPRDGVRRAARVQPAEPASSASCRTSTAPISSTRSRASTRPRRCSSSRRRRSRRSRRSRTRARPGSGCSTALGGDEAAVARHFVAVSTNAEKVAEFGIDPANMFEFWDWVGGRYSMWSAIGLSLMVAIGPDSFRELLAGAHEMDEHFRTAPLAENLPATLALLDVLVPRLLRRADARGRAVRASARQAAVVSAAAGDGEQRQVGAARRDAGGAADRCDRVGDAPARTVSTRTSSCCTRARRWCRSISSASCSAQPDHELGRHQDLLFANLLAQSEALAFGTAADVARGRAAELVPHRTFPGNRPSNVLVAEQLTPHTLGALIAAYEHKVMTLGMLWSIDSFDQWGVELGKVLATPHRRPSSERRRHGARARQLDERAAVPLRVGVAALVLTVACTFGKLFGFVDLRAPERAPSPPRLAVLLGRQLGLDHLVPLTHVEMKAWITAAAGARAMRRPARGSRRRRSPCRMRLRDGAPASAR